MSNPLIVSTYGEQIFSCIWVSQQRQEKKSNLNNHVRVIVIPDVFETAPSIYIKFKILIIYKQTTSPDRLLLQIPPFCIRDFPVTSISEDFFPPFLSCYKRMCLLLFRLSWGSLVLILTVTNLRHILLLKEASKLSMVWKTPSTRTCIGWKLSACQFHNCLTAVHTGFNFRR